METRMVKLVATLLLPKDRHDACLGSRPEGAFVCGRREMRAQTNQPAATAIEHDSLFSALLISFMNLWTVLQDAGTVV
jgi:hypothetical protein